MVENMQTDKKALVGWKLEQFHPKQVFEMAEYFKIR